MPKTKAKQTGTRSITATATIPRAAGVRAP
jgi:hypothetical protein